MEKIGNPLSILPPQSQAKTSSETSERLPDDRLLAKLVMAGVPPRYRMARLADFHDTRTTFLDRENKSCSEPTFNQHGMFLVSPAGLGKTHYATAVFADAIQNRPKDFHYRGGDDRLHLSAKWISVPDFLLQLRDTFHRDSHFTEKSIQSDLGNARLLLLDDLGSEKVTDWTLQSLYQLISHRVNYLYPTIITTNMKLGELQEFDQRLASRLGGMNYYRLDGPDRRLA